MQMQRVCPECGTTYQNGVSRCPRCGATDSSGSAVRQTVIEPIPVPPPTDPRATHVEVPDVPTNAMSSPSAPNAPQAFRPLNRPPLGLLTALDDGQTNFGETWRIRGAQHVIGRNAGNTIIPHDGDISAKHAEITCRWLDGQYRWLLADLGSTNGTFVRGRRLPLVHGKQIILGSRRYEFLVSGSHSAQHRQGQTLALLKEISSRDGASAIQLSGQRTTLGTDTNRCDGVIAGDPFVDTVHAQVFLHQPGKWIIEDLESLNGVWLRINRIELRDGVQFQLGEQRFVFQLPSP